jgi:hypothetical protein
VARGALASPEQVARILEQKEDTAMEPKISIQELEELVYGIRKSPVTVAAKDKTVTTLPQKARRNPP